ncbi:hypothetical protein [Paludibacterium purpuratum]|uniref:Uncharacterized protein n=1 Tax=Paludibacterium purpuratum TaxID=1144873 RepID=A0A4R7BA42_9NEIS|nr:hypothetical protein [Paludibacterium purpuratum]TDR80715.1 hypothetical protein DFP86_104215 [Paludibacterium purpuratum]
MSKPCKLGSPHSSQRSELRRVLLSDGHCCFTPQVQRRRRRTRPVRPQAMLVLLAMIILLQAVIY